MSSDGAAQKRISLRSSDGYTFELGEAAALQSQLLKHMIKENIADNIIPVPNITSKILARVTGWMNYHAEAAALYPQAKYAQTTYAQAAYASYWPLAADEIPHGTQADYEVADYALKAFDAEFVKVDNGTLFDLIAAANYLNIKGLLDLTCHALADMIDWSRERRLLNDFNPELLLGPS